MRSGHIESRQMLHRRLVSLPAMAGLPVSSAGFWKSARESASAAVSATACLVRSSCVSSQAVVIDGVGCRCALIDLDRVYRPAAKVEVLLRAGDGGADRWCLSQK
jgi:hypothetical protein